MGAPASAQDHRLRVQLLNHLTRRYLREHNPENLLFLGISDGNGLEHVDVNKAQRICGIDINDFYLEVAQKEV